MAVRRHIQTAGSGTLVRRTTYLVALMGFFALVLLARMSHLQLVRHSHYAGQAQANQVQPRRIAPRRGIILDRNGEILVANRASFRLILVAEQAEDAPGMLTRLEDQGFVKTERQGELMEALRLSPSFAPLAVRAMLPDEQAARFAVRRHQFAGVDIEGLLLREYPLGPSGAHALGYVAAVSAADKQRLDPSVYAGIPLIGKTGVEGSYEEDLRGSAGGERILMDAYGRPLERTSDLDPLPGGDLQLALDGELQREAFAAMESRRGADHLLQRKLPPVRKQSLVPRLEARGPWHADDPGCDCRVLRRVFLPAGPRHGYRRHPRGSGSVWFRRGLGYRHCRRKAGYRAVAGLEKVRFQRSRATALVPR